ncbi:MAG: signal peptidase I [Patescibacteria group bacterium]
MKKIAIAVSWIVILGSIFAFLFFYFSPYRIAVYSGEGSMYPTIKIGDLIVLKTVNPKTTAEFKEGMIIAFDDNDYEQRIIHRVIFIRETEIITKGDFNQYQDSSMPVSQIKEVYFFKIPTSAICFEGVFPIVFILTKQINNLPLGFYVVAVLLFGLVLANNFKPRGK